MDGNIQPYPSGDERNSLVDAMADAEHEGDQARAARIASQLANWGIEYGDTPAYRRTGITDREAAGLDVPIVVGVDTSALGAAAAYRADARMALDVRDPSPHIREAGAWSRPSRQIGTYAGED